jgi:hypothetical protein
MTDLESILSQLPPAELLAAAREYFKPTPHPLLPWFTDEQLLATLRSPGGADEVARLFKEREQRILLEGDDGEPLRYGSELPHWKDADAMLGQFKFLYVAGGKRASKSEWAAKRLVRSALKHPRGVLWAFQDNHVTSIATQQKLIWKFLPQRLKALNGKQDKRKVFNINYSVKNGFADNVIVLPNRTSLHFLTYNSEVRDYQGWEIGAPKVNENHLSDMERMCQELAGFEPVLNLGFWADEDMPLPWLETCEFRATTRNASGIWTFSTTEGITPTIKEVVGTAQTLETRPAELLANRVNLPLLPPGTMPYRQKAERNRWGAIYFFSEFNPFGDNYANVKAICEGKNSDFIMENAYGYAKDTKHKAFPLFGEWNIVKAANIPKKLTRYMLTDPGDASRNWATIWVGVDARGVHYIYRDWPDSQTYGEWAVPSDDPKQPDGERGPAQRSLGYGTTQLADDWRKLEGEEEIFERYIDPRAASNPHIEEHGGTNLYQKFAELPEPMLFTPWSGVEKSIGYTHINRLLFWERDKELCWPTNAPKLYVSEECHQVIWMFTHFTGMGGDRAGGKDFADLVRGMALADLQYYESNEMQSWEPKRRY